MGTSPLSSNAPDTSSFLAQLEAGAWDDARLTVQAMTGEVQALCGRLLGASILRSHLDVNEFEEAEDWLEELRGDVVDEDAWLALLWALDAEEGSVAPGGEPTIDEIIDGTMVQVRLLARQSTTGPAHHREPVPDAEPAHVPEGGPAAEELHAPDVTATESPEPENLTAAQEIQRAAEFPSPEPSDAVAAIDGHVQERDDTAPEPEPLLVDEATHADAPAAAATPAKRRRLVTKRRNQAVRPIIPDGASTDEAIMFLLGAFGGRHKALLTFLNTHRNALVTYDEIARALWSDDPPAEYRKHLRPLVSQVMKALRPAEVSLDVKPDAGYRLTTDMPVPAARWRELSWKNQAALRLLLENRGTEVFADRIAEVTEQDPDNVRDVIMRLRAAGFVIRTVEQGFRGRSNYVMDAPPAAVADDAAATPLPADEDAR